MKQKFCLGIFIALLLAFMTLPAYAAAIQIKIDGVAITTDTAPENVNNRTMAPLRAISNNLGAKVDWSDPKIVLSEGDAQLTLELNSSAVTKGNGGIMQLDAKPYLKNNRFMVPFKHLIL